MKYGVFSVIGLIAISIVMFFFLRQQDARIGAPTRLEDTVAIMQEESVKRKGAYTQVKTENRKPTDETYTSEDLLQKRLPDNIEVVPYTGGYRIIEYATNTVRGVPTPQVRSYYSTEGVWGDWLNVFDPAMAEFY